MQQYAQTEYAKSLTIASVYFGGGTPTVLNNKQMERLLKTLFNNFSTDPNIEITVEGTIKSFDQERLRITSYNVCYTKLLRKWNYPDKEESLRQLESAYSNINQNNELSDWLPIVDKQMSKA